MDPSSKISAYLQQSIPVFDRKELDQRQQLLWKVIRSYFGQYRVRSMYYQTLVTLVGNEEGLEDLIEKGYLREVGTSSGKIITTANFI